MTTIYVVSVIIRSNSSGCKNMYQRVFSTAEKACLFAQKIYLEEYNNFQMDELENYDQDFLVPSEDNAKKLFSSELLIQQGVIEYEPYNNYDGIIPFEIILSFSILDQN